MAQLTAMAGGNNDGGNDNHGGVGDDGDDGPLYRFLELDHQLDDILADLEADDGGRAIWKHLEDVARLAPDRPRATFHPETMEWVNLPADKPESPFIGDGVLGGGRVSVVDFWTYCCVNCMHVLPDLERLEERFPDVPVIGLHSAKFENEKVSDHILRAVQKYGIRHPVVNDRQATLWNRLGIRCWPTLTVLDPEARPIKNFVGEGHGDRLIRFVEVAREFYGSRGETQQEVRNRSSTNPEKAPTTDRNAFRFPGKVHCPVYPGDSRLFVADTGNHRILGFDDIRKTFKVQGGFSEDDERGPAPSLEIGVAGVRGFKDGPFDRALFNSPQGLCLYLGGGRDGPEEEEEILYVCDTGNHALRACDLKRATVTTVVGDGVNGSCHAKDLVGGKLGSEQRISSPWDVCLGSLSPAAGGAVALDCLFIAMAGLHQIWAMPLVGSGGGCFALAGSGAEENRNSSYPLRAGFAQPSGLAFDSKEGVLYVADSESSSVRKILVGDGGRRAVKAVVGGALDPTDLFAYGDCDGQGLAVRLQHPLGLALDNRPGVGNLFCADSYNHKVKRIKLAPEDQGKSSRSKPAASSCSTLDLGGAVLNEPGGLTISASEDLDDEDDGDLLVVADTNNWAIWLLELQRTTTVSGEDLVELIPRRRWHRWAAVEKPQGLLGRQAAGSKSDLKLRRRMVQFCRGGSATLVIKVAVKSEGSAAFNEDAPNSWAFDKALPDGWSSTSGTSGALQVVDQTEAVGKLLLQHPPPSQSEPCTIRVRLNLFICHKASGTCTVAKEFLDLDFVQGGGDDTSDDGEQVVEVTVEEGKCSPRQ